MGELPAMACSCSCRSRTSCSPEMIGSARETVTRAVDALEQNGFLRREDRGYVLRVSPGALER